LGGLGLIGTVGVPTLPFVAVRTAASILIATAAVVLPVASMTLAVLPAAALALPVMSAAVTCFTNIAAATMGAIEIRSAIVL
jgi:hypothetical protein